MVRRLLTWLAAGVGVVAFAVVCTVAYVALKLPRSLPPLAGHGVAAGITSPVEIVRDRNAVPHIFGKTGNDVYFGLGFAHAQDRLWQMAFYRRLLQGRVAEIAGAPAAKVDSFVRGFDIEGRAKDSLKALAPDARSALEAYAAGVNAWPAQRKANLPPEFHILFTDFEPWEPHHSLMLLKLLGLGLSNNAAQEIQFARLIQAIGIERAAELSPAYPDTDPITLREAAGHFKRAQAAFDPTLDAFIRFGGASNNWVVDGRFTSSGKPLLANDPHLGLSAPGVWYLAHLALPEGDVAGASYPGLPVIVLGHNSHFAWGFTTTHADTQDVVIERLDPKDPRRYETPAGSESFAERTETVRVRFARDRTLRVRETRHGPVLEPLFPALAQATPEGTVLALATPALSRADRSFETVLRTQTVKTLANFDGLFGTYVAPMQSIVYADIHGTIGFIAPAQIPIRTPAAMTAQSRLPVDGAALDSLWTGFVPLSGLPQARNPPAGQIYTANNKITPDDYPYFIASQWPSHIRARRIGELLSAGAPYAAEDFIRMQMDTRTGDADDLLPLLLAASLPGERERAAGALLSAWDRHMTAQASEPLIYVAWLDHLNRRIFFDELGELAPEYRGTVPLRLKSILSENGGEGAWCNDTRTPEPETCAHAIAASLADALDDLEARHGPDMSSWRWGSAHVAVHAHAALGSVPLVGAWFNREIEVDGGAATINRGDMPFSGARPYRSVHGAGLRAVYDLADLGASRFMISIGQSGNPLSTYYDNFLEPWAAGETIAIPLTRAEAEGTSIGVWRLDPQSPATAP